MAGMEKVLGLIIIKDQAGILVAGMEIKDLAGI